MLYYLNGTVALLEPGLAVIDCGGVGYGCRVTAYTAAQLKLNTTAKLYITESIREDAYELYGFASREEQRCYTLLTAVNGVGPKAANTILSELSPDKVAMAVTGGDYKLLTRAQGVGPKLAQRIVLEMKDKVGAVAAAGNAEQAGVVSVSGNAEQAVRALTVLGFTAGEASAAVARLDSTLSVEAMVKTALKSLSRR